MHRLGRLLVAAAVVVAVGVIAEGPAVAAKDGNSDNAHACQQGGHRNQFEAETGNPFKNAGDCASHAARGGALTPLQITTEPYTCPDGGPTPPGLCFGIISGSGLKGNSAWQVIDFTDHRILAQGETESDGTLKTTNLNVSCNAGHEAIVGQATTPNGEPTGVTVLSQCG